MKVLVLYVIAFFWGLATPSLAGIGAEYAIAALRPAAAAQGSMDFFLRFVGVALLCVFLFLLFDVIYARFLLRKNNAKIRHFFTCLMLYLLMCVGGWFLAVWTADWLGL